MAYQKYPVELYRMGQTRVAHAVEDHAEATAEGWLVDKDKADAALAKAKADEADAQAKIDAAATKAQAEADKKNKPKE